MKRRTKNLLVATLAAATTCLFGAALLPKTVTAEQQFVESSYNFVVETNSTKYNGVHYTNFDALSVNFPSTSVTGIVSIGFPFESTDMTAENAAIRIRVQTVVPVYVNNDASVSGKESLRFDLVGSSTMNMKTGATIYKAQNGVITTAQVKGSGTGAAFYVIDDAETAATKTFDGYLVFPVSVWGDNATAVTALNIRTNPLHTMGIWNFGDVEYGTVDENGSFTSSKTLWTPFDLQGNANSYTADASVDAELLKSYTVVGNTTSNNEFFLTTKLDASAENKASCAISEYDGIVVHVNNTGAQQSFQYYVWDAQTTGYGSMNYAWKTDAGLAYFMPDEDCGAFKNSFAFRSRMIPAGFKGEMYVPFTVNVNKTAEAGAWTAGANAGTTFPTALLNQIQVDVFSTTKAFSFGAPAFVEDGDAWMKEAFETAVSVNLGDIDDTKAMMVEQSNKTSSQFELWPTGTGGGTPNVKFSTVTTSNEVITGGTALAVALENLNAEAFKFKVTAYCKNSSGDRIEFGGAMAQAKVVFTNEDGSTQLLDIENGFVTIPAYAKGTITLPYVGAKAATLTYLPYPTDNLYRIWFNAVKVTGAKSSPAYLLGDIAVVNGNGTHTVMTVNGKGISELALNSADGTLKKHRSNVAYSGPLKYATASYETCENATIAVDKTSVRYNGEITYTVSDLLACNGLVSATLNGVDVTDKLVENDGNYTYTTRIKESSNFAISLAINDTNFFYQGASIRLKKANDATGDGIRFHMLLNKEVYTRLTANGNAPIFGTLVIPADMKNGELTKDTAHVSNTETNDVLMEVNVDGVDYISWVVYVWDIPEESYSRGFCARGYINVDGNYIYTVEKAARSISWVAQEEYADEEVSSSVKDLCEKYLPKVTFALNGAEGTVDSVTLYDTVTYALPTLETLGITAPEGKTLVGYSVYGNTYNVGDTLIISGNVTVTLVWGEN